MSGYCAFRTMDKIELQAISRRGGLASGEARRETRRRIEEKKINERALLEGIVENVRTLKQLYRAMTPEEREELYTYSRGQD